MEFLENFLEQDSHSNIGLETQFKSARKKKRHKRS